MIRVTILGSGSRGNAILVDGTEGSLLVDAGFSVRTLAKRMATAGCRPEQVSSLLLTHEHTDHASGAVGACARWRWPLYATEGTLAALRESADGCPERASPLATDDRVISVDGFDVQAIVVPHDARECAAMVITDQRSGFRLGIALDLGRAPAELAQAFARLDLLVVEANHDSDMLAVGPYPWPLKQRISGGLGHLSNDAAAAVAASAAHRALRGVVLAHLSETNNTPEAALTTVRAALRSSGWKHDGLWAAHQSAPCGPIGTRGLVAASEPIQLPLGF